MWWPETVAVLAGASSHGGVPWSTGVVMSIPKRELCESVRVL